MPTASPIKPAALPLFDLQEANPSTVCRVQLVGESGFPYTTPAEARRLTFGSSKRAFEFFRDTMQADRLPVEEFWVAAVDVKNRVLSAVRVGQGTLSQSLVHPREVFIPALLANAAGVLIAHNHPSGLPTPSPEDHEVTKRLKACADLLALTLVDHVIVGKGAYHSYADSGWPR